MAATHEIECGKPMCGVRSNKALLTTRGDEWPTCGNCRQILENRNIQAQIDAREGRAPAYEERSSDFDVLMFGFRALAASKGYALPRRDDWLLLMFREQMAERGEELVLPHLPPLHFQGNKVLGLGVRP